MMLLLPRLVCLLLDAPVPSVPLSNGNNPFVPVALGHLRLLDLLALIQESNAVSTGTPFLCIHRRQVVAQGLGFFVSIEDSFDKVLVFSLWNGLPTFF